MAEQTLAVKYRPKTFDDVVEQDSIKIILEQQLQTGETKNAYLFCGGAGTGKTTCARIFANEINKGQGNPIEMDAASNSSVEDVRNIIQQAKTLSLTSEYKVFIIDECHAISNTGWQAFLKLIEEPPAKSIFIFCTTDPQKIPKTILSRVQRYDFQRISQQGIVNRLLHILCEENEADNGERGINDESVEYIAKIADGGMRDAITLLDKCLAYSTELTLENVVAALGTADYTTQLELFLALLKCEHEALVIIDRLYASGVDLKHFIKQFIIFLLDCAKLYLNVSDEFISIPNTSELRKQLKLSSSEFNAVLKWLDVFVKLDSVCKYSSTVKYDIEARILLNLES